MTGRVAAVVLFAEVTLWALLMSAAALLVGNVAAGVWAPWQHGWSWTGGWTHWRPIAD